MPWPLTPSRRPLTVAVSLFLSLILVGTPVAQATTPPAQAPAPATPFIDLGNHWARSSILWLVDRGFVNGSENEKGQLMVRPDDPVTRAEVVKLVAAMKGLEFTTPEKAFADTAGHWANGYLAAAKEARIAQGYPDGTFHPNGLITRAELAALVGRAFARQGQTAGRAFPDVPTDHWAFTTIKAAVAKGWIRGFTDGTYRPNQQATRAEAFTILARVDDQQAMQNTLRSLATRKVPGSARQYMQAAIAALKPYAGLLPADRLSALEGDQAPAWSDPERIPAAAVFDHQAAMVTELMSQWESGRLRYPVAVTGVANLSLSARLGAETATADAEMVLGLQGHPATQMPKGTDPVNWTVAKSLVQQARQVLTQGKEALAAGNAGAAITFFRRAWEAGTQALAQAGLAATPQPDSDLDSDRVPDEIELLFGANPLLSDTDGDGLTDRFEIEYGGPIFQPGRADTNENGLPDGEEDTDQDGLTNLQEQKAGTNPLRADTDADGLSDGEEASRGTNPLKPDTDGDGISDGAEVRLGTNPRVRDATARATTSVQTPDGVATVTGPAAAVATLHVVAGEQTPYQGMPGLIGKVTDFTAAGPIDSARIELQVDPAALAGRDLSHLRVFYFDEALKTWRPGEGRQGYDPETGRFWAETTHFSRFVVTDETEWAGTWTAPIPCGDRSQEASSKPVDVVLAIDSSGSMADNDPTGLRKTGAVQMKLSLLQGDRAAVVDFDSSARLLQPLTGEFGPVYEAVQKIDANGGTSVDGGILAGLAQLANSPADRSRVIVILTDGENSPTPFDPAVIDRAVAAGVSVFTIGLGRDIDKPLLERIATETGGRYYQVLTAADLPKAFAVVNTTMGMTDSDGDGLSDCEETKGMLDAQGRRWYTDPQKADTDGDGLTDREEMGQYVEPDLMPGHPLQRPYWSIASDPTKADSDGDGLDDATERALGSSPLRIDSDNDGLTDKEEQGLGTNPLAIDTDHDTIDDASEVYSLYLNPLIPDEFLVSSDEWKVQYYKGFKLDGNCVKTDDRTDLRRCLGTLPFRLGQGAATVSGPVNHLIESVEADANFALGFTGAIADHLVTLTGENRLGITAYYNAPESEALKQGETAGDSAVGFALQFLLNQAEMGTGAANLFGADLSIDGLRDYMADQSRAFQYGRTASDVFQGLVGITQIISGIGTIIGSVSGGALVAVGTAGISLPGGVAIAWAGVAEGTAQVSIGAVLMAKAQFSLNSRLKSAPKNTGMSTSEHATKLKKNMVKKQGPPPEGYAAHHIVPSTHTNSDAIRAREILEKWGIEIDSADNGVYLWHDKKLIGASAYHPKIHKDGYFARVASLLQRAKSREQAVATLRAIATQLETNSFVY